MKTKVLITVKTYPSLSKKYDESSSYKLWVINDQCKCAKSMAKQIYTKNRLPKLPCHVGCNCGLNTIHK